VDEWWACEHCHSMNRPNAPTCYSCRAQKGLEPSVQQPATVVRSSGAAPFDAAYEQPQPGARPGWGPPAGRKTPVDHILVIVGLVVFGLSMGLALIGLLLLGLFVSSDTWQTADYGGTAARLLLVVAAIVSLVFAAAIASMKLGARYEGLNDPPRYVGAWADPTWPGASITVARYLWDVNAELRLPPGIAVGALEATAREIYAAMGIADPLGQRDEGLVTQVLLSFSSPADAASRIKENQHLLPRPALGVAGGIVAMACGAVAALLVVSALSLPYGLVRPAGSSDVTAIDLFALAVACVFIAFYAARRAVRVSAAISRRMVADVGIRWAVVGSPLLAIPALLLIPLAASLPQVMVQILMVPAFALGATLYVDRPWPMRP
jgi:hypothetical protein